MEAENAQDSEQHLNNNNPPPPIINAPADKPDNTQQTQNTQTPPQEPVRIIIEKDERRNAQSVVANIISGCAVVLAAIALIYTYKLYGETTKANNTSDSTLQLSRQQFEQSKRDNEETKRIQVKRDAADCN